LPPSPSRQPSAKGQSAAIPSAADHLHDLDVFGGIELALARLDLDMKD